MTPVTNVTCLASKTSLGELFRRLPFFDEELPALNTSVQQAVGMSLKETLAGLQSEDLETVATVLRNVVGQIDTLLLERQLAECGFDAVRAVSYNARCPSLLAPADVPVLSHCGTAT
ncbi:hypothetical protein KTQ42_19675 [Noviherbaspirillum sp. L7-7A]|uniref:hypothetical protein n=1 Tax=Noviherbaspirillum sp. L7-7A TaxID=2850560 RepID=UPI001C2BA4D6|nr:hypothetical protein [Noviherbaspirillum sp. L7-7A]MBV0881510.1 hypothetical protein [Noviherbaspirillum sp. L7-7A]